MIDPIYPQWMRDRIRHPYTAQINSDWQSVRKELVAACQHFGFGYGYTIKDEAHSEVRSGTVYPWCDEERSVFAFLIDFEAIDDGRPRLKVYPFNKEWSKKTRAMLEEMGAKDFVDTPLPPTR
jgi:hypothetical protein